MLVNLKQEYNDLDPNDYDSSFRIKNAYFDYFFHHIHKSILFEFEIIGRGYILNVVDGPFKGASYTGLLRYKNNKVDSFDIKIKSIEGVLYFNDIDEIISCFVNEEICNKLNINENDIRFNNYKLLHIINY